MILNLSITDIPQTYQALEQLTKVLKDDSWEDHHFKQWTTGVAYSGIHYDSEGCTYLLTTDSSDVEGLTSMTFKEATYKYINN